MPNVPIRIRHPRGVTTLELDPEMTTLDALRVLIFSSTEIPPNEQEIKFGYPPKPLPSFTGPISSIPINRGEQLIITSNPDAPIAIPEGSGSSISSSSQAQQPTPTRAAPSPTPAPSVKQLNQTLSAPSPLPPSSSTPFDGVSEEDAQAIAAAQASFDSPPTASSTLPTGLTGSATLQGTATAGADSVKLPGRDAGSIKLRVVPDDNSCLFSAIGVIFAGGMEAAQELRKVVADEIRKDADTWSDVVLGQSRASYIQKITDNNTWGGAIELTIFAKYFKTEISSFDVATGRCDRFGEGEYDTRCVVVYSGIHYDAITLSPTPDAPPEFHTTVFPTADDSILDAAQQLVGQLKARHYYTDTTTFDLRCGTCGEGLKGEKGAREHAMVTGHVDFGEY